MTKPNPASDSVPTFTDWHDLQFWTWAFLRDADTYLATSCKLSLLHASFPSALKGGTVSDWDKWSKEVDMTHKVNDLEKYHLIATMGSLLRNLKHSYKFFPTIRPT